MKNKTFSLWLNKIKNKADKAMSAILAITILLTTGGDFIGILAAELGNQTPPISINNTFDKASTVGYMDPKTAIMATGQKTTLSIQLAPQFQTGYTKNTVVSIFLPSYNFAEDGSLIAVQPGEQPGEVGIQGDLVVGDDWELISDKSVKGGYASVRYIGSINAGG